MIKEICSEISDRGFAEVAATDAAGMIAEGEKLAQIITNVVIKLPLFSKGLRAFRHFSAAGKKTNATLCFAANHFKDAALAGAEIATAPPLVIKRRVTHPLTDKRLSQSEKDWVTTGQSIL